MIQALCIGDLHLDGMTADLGPEANRLQMAEVARAESYAARNEIDHILYLGDLCNRSVMSYEAHGLLSEQWNKYPHIKRHVILGNHDVSENGIHSLRLMVKLAKIPHVTIYEKPKQVTLGGVTFNFLPYPYPDYEVDFEVENCVNLAHFEAKGSVRDNGTKSSCQTVVSQDALWVLGHLHTPHDIGDYVHYVGTLYQRNFGESMPKGFTHLKARMNNKGKLEHKLVRIQEPPAFSLTNLVIESAADLKRIDSNPLHLYKLFVGANVRVPETFMQDHPNVVRSDNFRTKQEKDAMVHNKIIVNQAAEGENPYEGLEDYLKVYHPQLTRKQLTRADAIMSDIHANLQPRALG